MATEYYYYLGQQLQALAGAMFHAGDQQTAIAEQQTVIADQQTVIARLQEEVELVKNRADAAVEVAASAVSVTAKALKELEDETTRADAAELDSHIARCRTLEAPPPLTLDDIEAYVLTGSGLMCRRISFQPTADSPASPASVLLFSPAAQWPTPGTFSP